MNESLNIDSILLDDDCIILTPVHFDIDTVPGRGRVYYKKPVSKWNNSPYPPFFDDIHIGTLLFYRVSESIPVFIDNHWRSIVHVNDILAKVKEG